MLRLDNNSNAPESFYKEIVYNPAEGNPRFEDFIDEYFKGGTISEGRKRSRKKDKSKYKAYLKTFYTKKILILDDISHAKSVGLWEVTLSKNI